MLPLNLVWEMAQTRWASLINPILRNFLVQGMLLSNIDLIVGINVINHKLGRNQIGWVITDIDNAAQIYRSAALNSLTLTLTSDTACTVSLWVF